jgi:phage RecT family recombinase
MNTAAPVNKFDPNKPAASAAELRSFLDRNAGSIQRVAAQVMNPHRMVAILAQAFSRSPILVKCTPLSLLRCLAQGAELGLEVAGQLQEFHPVPYWNNNLRCYEAQGIPGYPGLVKLVLQDEKISRVLAQFVYRSDIFDFEYGDKPFLKHKPDLSKLGEDQPDSEIIAFYAVAFLKDGSSIFEVMGRAAVDKIKQRAQEKKKDAEKGPWVTDYAQMGIKTGLRRLCKRLPKSAALAKALDLQAQAEAGEFPTDPGLTTILPDIEGEKVNESTAGATGATGSAQPKGPSGEVPNFAFGSSLSAAQLGACRGHVSRLGLNAIQAERVLAAVSNMPKTEARKFVDELFSRDDGKIRIAFEGHPEWPEPAPAPTSPESSASDGGEAPTE